MRKSLRSLVFLMVLSFVLSEVCFAQLINYNRRQNASGGGTGGGYNAPAPQPEAPAPAEVAQPQSEEPAVMEISPEPMVMDTSSDFKVTNRIEEIYDANKDGALQSSEVTAFKKDVVSAVFKKGSFTVSSELLKEYDQNDDGKISKSESEAIESAIR